MTRKTKLISVTIGWGLWALILHRVNVDTQPNPVTFALFAVASLLFGVLICFLFFNRQTP